MPHSHWRVFAVGEQTYKHGAVALGISLDLYMEAVIKWEYKSNSWGWGWYSINFIRVGHRHPQVTACHCVGDAECGHCYDSSWPTLRILSVSCILGEGERNDYLQTTAGLLILPAWTVHPVGCAIVHMHHTMHSVKCHLSHLVSTG